MIMLWIRKLALIIITKFSKVPPLYIIVLGSELRLTREPGDSTVLLYCYVYSASSLSDRNRQLLFWVSGTINCIVNPNDVVGEIILLDRNLSNFHRLAHTFF